MKNLFLILSMLLPVAPCFADTVYTNYITRSVDKLMDGSQEFRFISFNDDSILKNYDGSVPDPREQEDAIRTIAQMGGQVLRCYCISVGNSQSHVTAPNTFSEEYFLSLDKLLELANLHGVRLIIPFVDNYQYHVGGIRNYETFRGGGVGSFYVNSQIKQDFKATISYMLNRTNVYTGVQYKNDKAILAWELGNEIQPSAAWTSEMGGHIKSIDTNHLVMDGKALGGIPPTSLTDINIDVVTAHYYPGQVGQNYATACDNARNLSRDKKVLIIGEFGEYAYASGNVLASWSTTVGNFLDTVIANGTSGAMAWALRHHTKSGGFFHHPDTLQDYRWPGFPSGDAWQETYKVNVMREHAFQIRGLSVPSRETPLAPVLLPISQVSSISWIGSAGADTYDVERSASSNGPWTVVGTNVLDSAVPYQPFNDTSATGGDSYYYRVKGKNVAGVSLPSSVVGPVVVLGLAEIVDEMSDFTETYSHTANLAFGGSSSSFFNGDIQRLSRTAATAENIVYRTPGDMVTFSVSAYFWPYESVEHLKFYTSADGVTYTLFTPTIINRGGDWINIDYAASALPAGTRYLKIVIMGVSVNFWNPQICRIKIDYGCLSASDSDGDGLPNTWEITHELNSHNADDAGHDDDSDGMSNLQEYMAGTNPKNGQDRFQVTTMTKDGVTGFVITWRSVPGKNYKVTYADSPGGSWQEDLPNSEIMALTGQTSLSYVDASANGVAKRFYRVKVVP